MEKFFYNIVPHKQKKIKLRELLLIDNEQILHKQGECLAGSNELALVDTLTGILNYFVQFMWISYYKS